MSRRAHSTRFFLALSVALSIGCTQHVRYTERFEPEGPVQRIVLSVDEGMVELTAGDKLSVERSIRAAQGTLALSHDLVDGVLRIDAHCTSLIPCAVDSRVVVPDGVAVEVELGSGELWASGIGELQARLGDGEADVEVYGPLGLQVGSGMARAALQGRGAANVAVGSGDIELFLDSGPWQLGLTARHTEVDAGLEPVPQAAARVEAVAPGGSVRVLLRDPLARR